MSEVNNQLDFKFNLGDKVKDKITGFTGIITSRTQWLNSNNSYGVQSQELNHGIPRDRQLFNESQLEIISEKEFIGFNKK